MEFITLHCNNFTFHLGKYRREKKMFAGKIKRKFSGIISL